MAPWASNRRRIALTAEVKTYAEIGPSKMDRLVRHLLEHGLDPHALGRAQRAAEGSRQRLDQVLVRLGMVSERAMFEAYGGALDMVAAASDRLPEDAILSDELPASFLENANILPLSTEDGMVQVAVVDPFDEFSLSAIRLKLGKQVQPFLIAAADFKRAFTSLYAEFDETDHEQRHVVTRSEAVQDDVSRLRDLASDAPVVRFVNGLINQGVAGRASDIHLSTSAAHVRVRFRVDGVLSDVEHIPLDLRPAIISRLKIMADLDIAEQRLPQDGRIKVVVSGREVDIRISTMPHLNGEGAVLRILDRSDLSLNFSSLGFEGEEIGRLRGLLKQPHGIILLTGPTGSGKTTTLYAALAELAGPETNIVSVEDPVEYQIDGVNQIQIAPKIGLTFASVLRSVLRQDPDIIMVGEIRDGETAAIANQAALTGHLVLGTLHTNSAAAALPRLIDMGVENYLLGTTLRGVVSQRLLRLLCFCKEPYQPSDGERTWLSRIQAGGVPELLCRPRGCGICSGSGYRGRTVIAEILTVSPNIRASIGAGGSPEIERIARLEGTRSLLASGVAKVMAHVTSVDEVQRVCGVEL